MTGGHRHLLAGPDGTSAFFALGDTPHTGQSAEQHEDTLRDVINALADLGGHRLWLRGTSQDWNVDAQLAALHERYPAPAHAPDLPYGARTRDDLLAASASAPAALNLGDPVIVAGVQLTRQRLARQHMARILSDDPIPPTLSDVADVRSTLRSVTSALSAEPLSAAPLAESAIRWLADTSLALGHDPDVIPDVTDNHAGYEGSRARVRRSHSRAFDPTLASTAITHDGRHSTRHLTVLHVEPTFEGRDSTEVVPLLAWLTSLRCEWVASFDVIPPENMVKVSRQVARRVRERVRHDHAHGIEPDQGVIGGDERARETVAEVEQGSVTAGTRVWGRIMVAISGDSEREVMERVDRFVADARRYARAPFTREAGMDADALLFVPGEPWPAINARHNINVLRWPLSTLAALGPGVTGRAGDPVGMYVGPVRDSPLPYLWHPHGGAESDGPNTWLVIARQGGGKSHLAGSICDFCASVGISTRIFDPSDRLTALTRTPHLRDSSVAIPLTGAVPAGILQPHFLDLDPSRAMFAAGEDGDREHRTALASVRALRMDRAIDAIHLLLPNRAIEGNPDAEAAIKRAVTRVGGEYGTDSREILAALKADPNPAAHDVRERLLAESQLAGGRLIFPDSDTDMDKLLRRMTGDALLTVITAPGIDMPQTSNRADWTASNRLAALIGSLGWQLAVRDAWSNTNPVTAWVDEMTALMEGVSSVRSGMLRAFTDSRKVDLSIGVGSQTPGSVRAIDPNVENLVGTVFLGAVDRVTAAATLPLMGITETGTGWADRAAALPYGPGATTRRMVVSGWDRRVAEVTVDRSHMHPDLLRALDTTPPHKRVTIRDRVRAEATA